MVMSSRNMRKMFGGTTLPAVDDDSDDEPVYQAGKSFSGLVLDSDSASQDSSAEQAAKASEEDTETALGVRKKTKKKKKKKKKLQCASAPCPESLDEVDRSVLEVNQLLGTPAAAAAAAAARALADPSVDTRPCLRVELRHLNAENEMRRMFGPGDAETQKRNRKSEIVRRLQKKFLVVPMEGYKDIFRPAGLSMSVSRRDGVAYFTLDHAPEYQRLRLRRRDVGDVLHPAQEIEMFHDAQRTHHVEALIEYADLCFMREDNTNAIEFVKMAIAYLQYVAHPSFQPTDSTVRLEYNVLENRIVHIAILKQIYLLTNKACHRTALELAKMLLNLDPSDPLAVILVIDTLALRAYEHEWLIEAVRLWDEMRGGRYMHNLRFSHALAVFHARNNNKEDIAEATALLEEALIDFPTVCHQMLRACNYRMNDALATHPLFNELATTSTKKTLTDLTNFYCNISWSKWNEPKVQQWFVSTCTELGHKYTTRETYRVQCQNAALRRRMYAQLPDELHRHFCVIRSMSSLVANNAVPEVPTKRAIDPRPPAATINRYNYQTYGQATPATRLPLIEVALQMLTSANPGYARPPPEQPPRDE